MDDSTFNFSLYQNHIIDSVSHDTISAGLKVDSMNIISKTFFQHSTIEITPVLNASPSFSWFIYLLLFLSFSVALIWYFIPERILYAFSITMKPDVTKLNEKERPDPGAVITIFFLINALINLGFLIYYTLVNIFNFDFGKWTYWEAVFYIAIISGVFFIIKMLLVVLAGWTFNTLHMAKKQLRIYFNSNITLGVILLPLLFILLIIAEIYVLYSILFIVAIVFLIRWIQVISLGISITRFNFFHLILYLCTLEIIPMVVLIKIFM